MASTTTTTTGAGAADFLRDRELAQWLEQRLDSSAVDDLWAASRNLCSVFTKEILTNIPSCFVDLQTHAKWKILLSILYFPKRNVEQWRDEIEDILSLACQDTDEWVQTMAELLKEYPTTSGISFNMDNDGGQFNKTLVEFKKILKRQAKGVCSQVLPLDATYMNKQASQLTWGVQVQQTSTASARFFSLKRKPKAAAQRVEFLQKSADAATQMKYKNNGSLSSILPIRHKNTVRKMDDQTPMRGIPTQNTAKSATSGFRPSVKPINRQVSIQSTALPRRQMGNGPGAGSGVKLIDINDTPQALEKKRKTMEAEEKAAKKAAKEEQKRQREEEKSQKKLQRDMKVTQRSLQHAESRLSESSTGANEEGKDPSALIQPTPDYAAELFEGVGASASSRINPNVQPPTFAASTSTPSSSATSHGPMENHSASATPSTGLFSMANTTSLLSDISVGAITPSSSHFFSPASVMAASTTSTPSAIIPTSPDDSGVPPMEAMEPAKGGAKKRGKGAAVKSTAETPKTKGRAKKRKDEATPSEVGSPDQQVLSPPVQQPQQQQRPPVVVSIGQTPSGITVQPAVQQQHQPLQQFVQFQYGGMTASTGGAATTQAVAGRGLAQMAQNVFVAQQGLQPQQQQIAFMPQMAIQQPPQAGQQMVGPRTIVFVQQAPASGGSVSTQMAPGATMNIFNSAPGAQSVLVRQQQPQAASMTTFTPSVIRQPVAEMTTAATGLAAMARTRMPTSSTLRPMMAPVLPQQLVQAQQVAGTSDSNDPKKPTFTITKDVMLKAQEMFRTANKLSRPEKALILGFMAGNRENPCPQMGRILTVRLSENQDAQSQADGSSRPVMVETYFQMNYDTGEWKQIRKIRPLREGEGQQEA